MVSLLALGLGAAIPLLAIPPELIDGGASPRLASAYILASAIRLPTQLEGGEASAIDSPHSASLDEPEDKLGTLVVRVLRKTSNEPVGGIDVTVASAPEMFSSTPSDVEPRVQTTKPNGEAEFEVPSARSLMTSVNLGNGSGRYTNFVEPLEAGERRVVTVTVANEPLLSIRVLDQSSKEPIEGAELYINSVVFDREASARTDKNGIAALQLAQNNHSFVTIQKQGYEPRMFAPSLADFEHSGLLTAWISESASLRVEVATGGGRPSVGESIRVCALPSEQETSQRLTNSPLQGMLDDWEGVTDERGVCVLEGLPANRALTVWCNESVATATPIILASGERRELSLGPELVTFTGRVIDESGSRESMKLVLVRSLGSNRALLSEDLAVLQHLRTDRDGNFSLTRVAPGDYHIGPDPNSFGGRRFFTYPRIGVPVKVETGMEDVVLRLDAPTDIHGTLSFMDSDNALGEGAFEQVQVFASAPGETGRVRGTLNREFNEATGTFSQFVGNEFSIGPLTNGPYEVRAETRFGIALGSTQAIGGSTDLELILERGHEIRFQAEPYQRGRLLLRKKEPGATVVENEFRNPDVPLFGLSAGDYEALFCPAGNSWAFLPSITVPAEEGKVIPLVPQSGGWLRVLVDGQSIVPARVDVRLGELVVGSSLAMPKSTIVFRVPATVGLSVYVNGELAGSAKLEPWQEQRIVFNL